MKTFEVVSIYLAAAILTEINNCDFQIEPNKIIDGKIVIKLSYPDGEEENLKKIAESYQKKELLVDLYKYNHNLTIIRNALFSKGVRNAKQNRV